MRCVNLGLVIPLLALVSACDGRGTSTSGSSPTGPTAIVLLGQITDRTTGAPIAGATVSLNGWHVGTTDSLGNYTSSAGALGREGITFVEASNYASDHRFVGRIPHNVHLYPITRITAGDSTPVIVAPDDTLCVNNVQDSPGLGADYLCRSVRVVAASAGVLTLEALSTNGPPPLLEVEVVSGGSGPCCSERLANPTSILVTAGMEVVAHVEIPFGSASAQSFILNTSLKLR